MSIEKWSVFGPLALIVLFLFTGLSIIFSPWFRLETNALSDLGNPSNGYGAILFNSGVEVSGIMLLLYSLKSLKNQADKTSYGLALTSFFLVFVGMFDESYGHIHTAVSSIMFASLLFSSILYFAEKKSRLALVSAFSMISFAAYFLGYVGAAIPETVSWVTASLWVVSSASPFLYRKTNNYL